MRRAEKLLTVAGRSPARVVATLREEFGIGERQGWRYVRAVRAIYAHADEADLLSPGEHLRLLLARAEDAIGGRKPDFSASVKALEVYARMRGWLDRKSTLDVNVNATVQHVAALDGLSTEALEALARAHALIARDRQLAQPQGDVVDAETTATEPEAVESAPSHRPPQGEG